MTDCLDAAYALIAGNDQRKGGTRAHPLTGINLTATSGVATLPRGWVVELVKRYPVILPISGTENDLFRSLVGNRDEDPEPVGLHAL
jgi:hypothetical protein